MSILNTSLMMAHKSQVVLGNKVDVEENRRMVCASLQQKMPVVSKVTDSFRSTQNAP